MAERTTVSDSEGEKRKSSNDSERASDNDNNNNIGGGGGIKNKSTETATAHSPTFPQSDRLSRKVWNLQRHFAILGFLRWECIHSVNRK